MSLFDEIQTYDEFKALNPVGKRTALSMALDEDMKNHPEAKEIDPNNLALARDQFLDDYLKGPETSVGGIVKSGLRGVAEGVTTEIPGMIGRAGEFIGNKTGLEGVESAGRSLKDWSEEKSKDWFGEQPERSTAEKIVYEGTKMLGPSIIPGGALVTGGRAILGVSKFAKLAKAAEAAGDLVKAAEMAAKAKSTANIALEAGGATNAIALFGASAAQQTIDSGKDTADRLERAGDYEGAKKALEATEGAAPYFVGAIEAAGEYLGTKFLGKLFGLSESEVLKRGYKELSKELPKVLGVELGTEMGQSYGESTIEKTSGIRPEADPWKETLDVIGPTSFMTLLTFGLAAGHNRLLSGKGNPPEGVDREPQIDTTDTGVLTNVEKAFSEGAGHDEIVQAVPEHLKGPASELLTSLKDTSRENASKQHVASILDSNSVDELVSNAVRPITPKLDTSAGWPTIEELKKQAAKIQADIDLRKYHETLMGSPLPTGAGYLPQVPRPETEPGVTGGAEPTFSTETLLENFTGADAVNSSGQGRTVTRKELPGQIVYEDRSPGKVIFSKIFKRENNAQQYLDKMEELGKLKPGDYSVNPVEGGFQIQSFVKRDVEGEKRKELPTGPEEPKTAPALKAELGPFDRTMDNAGGMASPGVESLKKPWQMTKAEFAKTVKFGYYRAGNNDKNRRLFAVYGTSRTDDIPQKHGKLTKPESEVIGNIHRREIEGRIKQNQRALLPNSWEKVVNIPPEVLSEYPQLAGISDSPSAKTDTVPRSVPESSPAATPAAASDSLKITPPIKQDEFINGITRAAAGIMLKNGDEAVLEHIREGIQKHGIMAVQDAIRNQEIKEVAKTPKDKRGEVRERLARLRPQIDKIFDEERTKTATGVGSEERPQVGSAPAVAGEGVGTGVQPESGDNQGPAKPAKKPIRYVTPEEVEAVKKKIADLRSKAHGYLNSIRGKVLPNGKVVGRDSSKRGENMRKAATKMFEEASQLYGDWFAATNPEEVTAEELQKAKDLGLPVLRENLDDRETDQPGNDARGEKPPVRSDDIPDGITVSINAIVEKTLKKISIKEDAKVAMAESKASWEKFKTFLECLKA